MITFRRHETVRGQWVRVVEAEKIIRRIQRRYDKCPDEEWRVLIGRDSVGRLTQLIGDSSDSWQIKGEVVSPGRFAGVGSQLKGLASGDLLDYGQPLYGVRTIGHDLLGRLLRGDSSEVLRELDLDLLPRRPFKEAARAGPMVEGPIIHSMSPITPISEGQRRLEVALNRGLDSLMQRKYPHTRSAYG